MEQAVLKAETREHAGSKHAARLRQQGRIPATVYGHKQDPESISLDGHDFVLNLHHGHRLFQVDIAGKTEQLLVKDLQYDYLGKDIIHIDFVRVNLQEKVHVTVPVELKGVARGTNEGGIIEEHLGELEVECLVSQIPDVINVSVREVGVGDVIHAGDITLPEGVKLRTDASTIVVTCHLVAAARTTEEIEEEMPAGPEVIGEREAEQEGEQEEQEEK